MGGQWRKLLRRGDYYLREAELTRLLGDGDEALDDNCHVTLDDGFAVPFVALRRRRLRRVQLSEHEWRDAGGGDAPDRPLAWCAHQDDASRGLAGGWRHDDGRGRRRGAPRRAGGAPQAAGGCELTAERVRGARRPAVTADAYVRDADGRCYRAAGRRHFVLDLGRTWADVETPEIDRIFECQRENDRFGAHDRFFIYALLGRGASTRWASSTTRR